MDNTELHYLTYDPDAILTEMIETYVREGGAGIYPGDEKEILLHGILQILVQAFAGVDNALRMGTLRYATGDYLDLIGENRDCERIEATAATTTATVTLRATGVGTTIPAGTTLTADGIVMWELDEDLVCSGSAGSQSVGITCTEESSNGNSLTAGTELQLSVPTDAIVTIVADADAGGGQDREDDDTYRERIRLRGLANNTSGPAEQYESIAMEVSGEIIDANAINGGGGTVNVYLLLEDDASPATLIAAVQATLDAESVRPLTDTVVVSEATAVSYTLDVTVTAESSTSQEAISAAVTEYQEWQDRKIGRAFNPDRLKALIYQAGATRVVFENTSSFDGGAAEYTEIAENEVCSGTINLVVS